MAFKAKLEPLHGRRPATFSAVATPPQRQMTADRLADQILEQPVAFSEAGVDVSPRSPLRKVPDRVPKPFPRTSAMP